MEVRISGKKLIWGIVIVVILAAIAAWAWTTVEAKQSPDGPSPYSAVYLTSGDVYFGRLSWFPEPHMTDVWYLNRAMGADGQSQVSVAPLKNVFWGPVNEVTFNPQQILFWTSLSNASQLVTDMENPSARSQTGNQQPPAALPSSVSSTAPAAH